METNFKQDDLPGDFEDSCYGNDTEADNDLDLYDDMLQEEDDQNKLSYQEMCKKFDGAMALITELETENKRLHEAIQGHETQSETIQRNMSSLMVTARGEISRKEKEILTLRNKLSKPYRRYQPGRESGDNQSFTSVDSNFDPLLISSPSSSRDERRSRTLTSTKPAKNSEKYDSDNRDSRRERSRHEQSENQASSSKDRSRSSVVDSKQDKNDDKFNLREKLKGSHARSLSTHDEQEKPDTRKSTRSSRRSPDKKFKDRERKTDSGKEGSSKQSPRKINKDLNKLKDNGTERESSFSEKDMSSMSDRSGATKVLDLREKLRLKRLKENEGKTKSETKDSSKAESKSKDSLCKLNSSHDLSKDIKSASSKQNDAKVKAKNDQNLDKERNFLENLKKSLKGTTSKSKTEKHLVDSKASSSNQVCAKDNKKGLDISERGVVSYSELDASFEMHENDQFDTAMSKKTKNTTELTTNSKQQASDTDKHSKTKEMEKHKSTIVYDNGKNQEDCQMDINESVDSVEPNTSQTSTLGTSGDISTLYDGIGTLDTSTQSEQKDIDELELAIFSITGTSNDNTHIPEPCDSTNDIQKNIDPEPNIGTRKLIESETLNQIDLEKESKTEDLKSVLKADDSDHTVNESPSQVLRKSARLSSRQNSESKNESLQSKSSNDESVKGRLRQRADSRRKSSESGHRRVISETVSSFTSAEMSDSVTEMFRQLSSPSTSECLDKSISPSKEKDKVESNANSEVDYNESKELVSPKTGENKVNVTNELDGNKDSLKLVIKNRETVQINDKPENDTAVKRHCDKEGCNLKFRHLHPKNKAASDAATENKIDNSIKTKSAINLKPTSNPEESSSWESDSESYTSHSSTDSGSGESDTDSLEESVNKEDGQNSERPEEKVNLSKGGELKSPVSKIIIKCAQNVDKKPINEEQPVFNTNPVVADVEKEQQPEMANVDNQTVENNDSKICPIPKPVLQNIDTMGNKQETVCKNNVEQITDVLKENGIDKNVNGTDKKESLIEGKSNAAIVNEKRENVIIETTNDIENSKEETTEIKSSDKINTPPSKEIKIAMPLNNEVQNVVDSLAVNIKIDNKAIENKTNEDAENQNDNSLSDSDGSFGSNILSEKTASLGSSVSGSSVSGESSDYTESDMSGSESNNGSSGSSYSSSGSSTTDMQSDEEVSEKVQDNCIENSAIVQDLKDSQIANKETVGKLKPEDTISADLVTEKDKEVTAVTKVEEIPITKVSKSANLSEPENMDVDNNDQMNDCGNVPSNVTEDKTDKESVHIPEQKSEKVSISPKKSPKKSLSPRKTFPSPRLHSVLTESPDKSFLLHSLLCGVQSVMKTKQLEEKLSMKTSVAAEENNGQENQSENTSEPILNSSEGNKNIEVQKLQTDIKENNGKTVVKVIVSNNTVTEKLMDSNHKGIEIIMENNKDPASKEEKPVSEVSKHVTSNNDQVNINESIINQKEPSKIDLEPTNSQANLSEMNIFGSALSLSSKYSSGSESDSSSSGSYTGSSYTSSSGSYTDSSSGSYSGSSSDSNSDDADETVNQKTVTSINTMEQNDSSNVASVIKDSALKQCESENTQSTTVQTVNTTEKVVRDNKTIKQAATKETMESENMLRKLENNEKMTADESRKSKSNSETTKNASSSQKIAENVIEKKSELKVKINLKSVNSSQTKNVDQSTKTNIENNNPYLEVDEIPYFLTTPIDTNPDKGTSNMDTRETKQGLSKNKVASKLLSPATKLKKKDSSSPVKPLSTRSSTTVSSKHIIETIKDTKEPSKLGNTYQKEKSRDSKIHTNNVTKYLTDKKCVNDDKKVNNDGKKVNTNISKHDSKSLVIKKGKVCQENTQQRSSPRKKPSDTILQKEKSKDLKESLRRSPRKKPSSLNLERETFSHSKTVKTSSKSSEALKAKPYLMKTKSFEKIVEQRLPTPIKEIKKSSSKTSVETTKQSSAMKISENKHRHTSPRKLPQEKRSNTAVKSSSTSVSNTSSASLPQLKAKPDNNRADSKNKQKSKIMDKFRDTEKELTAKIMKLKAEQDDLKIELMLKKQNSEIKKQSEKQKTSSRERNLSAKENIKMKEFIPTEKNKNKQSDHNVKEMIRHQQKTAENKKETHKTQNVDKRKESSQVKESKHTNKAPTEKIDILTSLDKKEPNAFESKLCDYEEFILSSKLKKSDKRTKHQQVKPSNTDIRVQALTSMSYKIPKITSSVTTCSFDSKKSKPTNKFVADRHKLNKVAKSHDKSSDTKRKNVLTSKSPKHISKQYLSSSESDTNLDTDSCTDDTSDPDTSDENSNDSDNSDKLVKAIFGSSDSSTSSKKSLKMEDLRQTRSSDSRDNEDMVKESEETIKQAITACEKIFKPKMQTKYIPQFGPKDDDHLKVATEINSADQGKKPNVSKKIEMVSSSKDMKSKMLSENNDNVDKNLKTKRKSLEQYKENNKDRIHKKSKTTPIKHVSPRKTFVEIGSPKSNKNNHKSIGNGGDNEPEQKPVLENFQKRLEKLENNIDNGEDNRKEPKVGNTNKGLLNDISASLLLDDENTMDNIDYDDNLSLHSETEESEFRDNLNTETDNGADADSESEEFDEISKSYGKHKKERYNRNNSYESSEEGEVSSDLDSSEAETDTVPIKNKEIPILTTPKKMIRHRNEELNDSVKSSGKFSPIKFPGSPVNNQSPLASKPKTSENLSFAREILRYDSDLESFSEHQSPSKNTRSKVNYSKEKQTRKTLISPKPRREDSPLVRKSQPAVLERRRRRSITRSPRRRGRHRSRSISYSPRRERKRSPRIQRSKENRYSDRRKGRDCPSHRDRWESDLDSPGPTRRKRNRDRDSSGDRSREKRRKVLDEVRRRSRRSKDRHGSISSHNSSHDVVESERSRHRKGRNDRKLGGHEKTVNVKTFEINGTNEESDLESSENDGRFSKLKSEKKKVEDENIIVRSRGDKSQRGGRRNLMGKRYGHKRRYRSSSGSDRGKSRSRERRKRRRSYSGSDTDLTDRYASESRHNRNRTRKSEHSEKGNIKSPLSQRTRTKYETTEHTVNISELETLGSSQNNGRSKRK